VEDGFGVLEFHDRAVGEDLLHAVDEDRPFHGAVEIVAHEKPAAQQELAEFGDLGIGQLPVAHLDGIEPRIVEDVVVFVEVDGLLAERVWMRVRRRTAAASGGRSGGNRWSSWCCRESNPSRETASRWGCGRWGT